MPREDSALLQKALRHKFKNAKLLEEALTHKSHAIERGSKSFNERLESICSICNSITVTRKLHIRRRKSDSSTKMLPMDDFGRKSWKSYICFFHGDMEKMKD
jgi:dsRNA-specific ribonuclease